MGYRRGRYIAVGVVAVVAVIIAVWLLAGGCNAIRDYFQPGSSDGQRNVNRMLPAEDVGLPDTARPVPVIEDSLTLAERVNPFHRRTHAEDILADVSAGTSVIEVTTDTGEEKLIYITEDGAVYEDGADSINIAAFRKPPSIVEAEFRPKLLGTTNLTTGGAGVAVDVIRVYDVHAGPGLGFNFDKSIWAGGEVGYNVTKNLDVGGYVGKRLTDPNDNNPGPEFGVFVSIAIE